MWDSQLHNMLEIIRDNKCQIFSTDLEHLIMDQESATKFIASLTEYLQSLCSNYVDYSNWVQVTGNLFISVDTGNIVEYIINEKLTKPDENSITLTSKSFQGPAVISAEIIPQDVQAEPTEPVKNENFDQNNIVANQELFSPIAVAEDVEDNGGYEAIGSGIVINAEG